MISPIRGLPMDDETFQAMAEAIIVAQSRALANQFILYEVVWTAAHSSGDPGKYLSAMYDRVCSRTDQFALDDEKKASSEMKDTIERFFSNISRNL